MASNPAKCGVALEPDKHKHVAVSMGGPPISSNHDCDHEHNKWITNLPDIGRLDL